MKSNVIAAKLGKKVYVKPVIRYFGPVVDHTRSGGTGGFDAAPNRKASTS